ncbi:hypothetical protein HHK36_004430 [Tetracentron sinense]|uniref:Uncharacterized protein n=1 Tax=Tetracentron sinense TaxID=13715 RepID=A0A835DQ93_TETSI|nr:hypothetical protein HHK36_004430 [Tetracentron sinense]
MDSSVAITHQSQIVQREREDLLSISKRRSSRRTQSSSSSSFSCSSSFGSSPLSSDSPLSPTTALQFSGIPFSWEQHPGIPKKHTHTNSPSSKNKDPSLIILPLPPSAAPIPSKKFSFDEFFPTRKKNSSTESSKRDPFMDALMECSKDNDELVGSCWKNSKVSRTLSDRFGFIDLYASCKTSCTVTESKVFLPRSSRTSYHLLNRRSG